MSAKRLWITILLALLLSAASYSQQAEETRRMLVYYEVLPEAQLTERETVLLYESLLIDLSDSSDRLAVKEFDGQTVPSSDEDKNRAAEERAADSWLHVAVSGSPDLLSLKIRALDLLSGRIVLDQTIEKEMLRGIRDLQLQFWREVAAPLADYFAGAITLNVDEGTLVFQGLPGTKILGSAWKKVNLDDEGRVSVQVPLPSTLPYRATKPGYFPVEGQVYMDQKQKTVTLEQHRGARLAFDAYLNNVSYPGVGLNYFFVPDTFYGRISFQTYLIGFMLDDRSDNPESLFISHSLSNVGLSAGVYFNDPDMYFRPYFAFGVAWRFVTAKGYWGLEPVAPFAAQPVLGCEYSRNPKFKVFAEYAPYFYWAPDRLLFALSLPEDRKSRVLYLPVKDDLVGWAWVWEMVVFNVGVRFRL
jgi:hypothetical protein